MQENIDANAPLRFAVRAGISGDATGAQIARRFSTYEEAERHAETLRAPMRWACVQELDETPAAVFDYREDTGPGIPFDEFAGRVGALRDAVAALHDLYSRHDELNFIQPDSLAACYKASLDEWAADLTGALADIEGARAAYRQLAAYGFDPEFAGGGCNILSTYRGDFYVWLTCYGGGGYPTADSWHVGVYAPENSGDALWQLTSEENGKGWSAMLAAVDAGIVTIERLSDGSTAGDGDDPCPVNRRPRDTCPDGCKHGEGV